ncbi:MAG: class I mannose-6-phosphate isomerase [Candidatus Nanopelagicales bacterium]|nr:class I mannose-6-phosphate isomerase [Candidatus Nanopelagicales bacterium]
MPELLVVEPVFAERLWGGDELRRWFGDVVPEGVIGECWAVSGMDGMSGRIRGHEGATLRDAWVRGLVSGRPESGEFPLLCKLLDPQDWLSVQVHPDDLQARALEGQPRGKAECWLVVSCADGAELILGHTAQSALELQEALADGTLMEHLVRVPVHQDDFFMVSAGTVHSLGPGMLVYEVQQASDITYRLYDFDRVGPDGRTRELHVDKGFSVVAAPHHPDAASTARAWQGTGLHARWRVLVDCPQFRVERWETVQGRFTMVGGSYRVVTCIGGSGTLRSVDQTVELGLGTSVVVPAGTGEVEVAGDVVLVVTLPGPALG